jgi:hypothetical protein
MQVVPSDKWRTPTSIEAASLGDKACDVAVPQRIFKDQPLWESLF